MPTEVSYVVSSDGGVWDSITCRRLLDRYHTAAQALAACLDWFARGQGVTAIHSLRVGRNPARPRQIRRPGGRLIFAGDPDYPPLLAQLDDAAAGHRRSW